MQQSDEYVPNGVNASAFASVVKTLLIHVLALEPTQETIDAFVSRLRGVCKQVRRLVADDDQHANPTASSEADMPADGVSQAIAAIDNGRAAGVLETLVKVSKG